VTKRVARIKSLPKSLTYFHQGKHHEGRFYRERIRWRTWTYLWDEAKQFGGSIPSLATTTITHLCISQSRG